ncbi:MAG: DUF3990 domain-containing protein [Firmicutes bacterium]|nr:DUF3990 domain-containing protein [Bacillota bacterium]MCM1393906.1 DUF3990 domain-containing protein [[Eubacterium] siraeum]
MILYHGTNLDIETIDLEKCTPYKDFGTGFYAATLFEQAKAMAMRKSRLYGGNPCVIFYEVPDDILELKTVKIKSFPAPSKDWAVFIINNRNRDFNDYASPLCNCDGKYEIVFGPVANDTLTTLIRRYQRGYIDSEILLKEMEYAAPNNQYSFHSPKAVALLKKVGVEWIK